MNRRTVNVGIAVLVGAAFGIWVNRDADRKIKTHWIDPRGHSFRDIGNSAEGIGYEGREDLSRRDRYEWMRLHDPRTGLIPPNIRQRELSFAATLPKREQLLAKSSGTPALTWTRRGPANVGGRTRAVGIDISNTNTILAGGVSGGMWRSTDAGRSWTKATALGDLQSCTCIAQDTRAGKTGTWYYGTGELIGNSASGGGGTVYRGDGIFKSIDSGVSWSRLPSTSTNVPQSFDQTFDYVWNVAVDPSNTLQDEVYAATIGTISRSTDGGGTWTIARGSFGTSDSRYTDVAVTPSGVVYAAMSATNSAGNGTTAPSAGIWRSPDGVSWTNITPANFPSYYGRIVIGLAPSNETVVYVLVTGTSGTNGVDQINSNQFWKYTYTGSGAGGTWENRGANLPSESGSDGNAVFDSQGGYDMIVRVKPDDPNFVIVGGVNLYRSTDGFATKTGWTRIGGYAASNTYSNYTNHHADQHTGAFKPGNSIVFLSGNDGGLAVTADITQTSVSWASLNNGYLTTQFYTIALDHGTTGDVSILGGTQDNGTWLTSSPNPTADWQSMLGGDGAYCVLEDGGAGVLVSAQEGLTYRFTQTDVARIDPTTAQNYLFINPFILDPNNSKMVYLLNGNTLWRNNDVTGIPPITSGSGATTLKNWDSLMTTRLPSTVYTTVSAARIPRGRVYLGASDGRIFLVEHADSSNATLVNISTGKGLPVGYVSCLAIDPTNGNNVLAAYSNYSIVSLFYTTDAGSSWTSVSGNLEQNQDGSGNGPSARWAAIVPYAGVTTYFVGTSTGLYSTTSFNGNSTTWLQEGSSTIGNAVVDMIDVRITDGTMVIGTHGNGVFSTTVPNTASVTVYPGDTNNDGVVDVRDLLAIGQFYSMVGPLRGGGVTWGAQSVHQWTPTGAAYADCDGNGRVDANDVRALIQNWSAVHSRMAPTGIDRQAVAEQLLQAIEGMQDQRMVSELRAAVNAYLTDRGIVAQGFSLEQNFPNPFNPSTTIHFTLPAKQQQVRMRIFDVSGKLVWERSMTNVESGNRTVTWDGLDETGVPVASGVYFYQLTARQAAGGQANNYSAVRKMIFLK